MGNITLGEITQFFLKDNLGWTIVIVLTNIITWKISKFVFKDYVTDYLGGIGKSLKSKIFDDKGNKRVIKF